MKRILCLIVIFLLCLCSYAEDSPSNFEVHYINNQEFYGQTTINARGDDFITISSAIQENNSDPDCDYQKERYQIT